MGGKAWKMFGIEFSLFSIAEIVRRFKFIQLSKFRQPLGWQRDGAKHKYYVGFRQMERQQPATITGDTAPCSLQTHGRFTCIYLYFFQIHPREPWQKIRINQHQKFIKLEFSIIMLRMLQGNDAFEQTRPWLQWDQYSQYFTPPSEELSSEIIVQVNGLF